jgi:hypothetical protein
MYFVPYTLKYKPRLVNFDESLIKSVVRKVKDVPDFQDGTTPTVVQPHSEDCDVVSVKEQMPVISTENNSDEAFMLRKTELPDIYEVYAFNNNTRGAKLGAAVIPNMKTSKMMRAIFKDTTVATYIKMTCIYKKEMDKWLPIALVN